MYKIDTYNIKLIEFLILMETVRERQMSLLSLCYLHITIYNLPEPMFVCLVSRVPAAAPGPGQHQDCDLLIQREAVALRQPERGEVLVTVDRECR